MRSTITPALTLLLAPLAAAQTSIHVESELFITNTGVVDDDRAYDGGPWSFGGLMTAMAGNVPPADFVEAWAATLISPSAVNSDNAANNISEMVLKQAVFSDFFSDWRTRSGGTFDLDSAPFRLLAIVNRPDLLKRTENGFTSAGEARLVFAAVDPSVADVRAAESGVRKFFVIFEYGIPASTCAEVQAWHEMWHDLGNDPLALLGESSFNSKLQLITDAFTLPAVGSGKPNGSLLNQLRTNEFALSNSSLIWDLREWNLVDAPGTSHQAVLQSVTVKQSPAQKFNTFSDRRNELSGWIRINQDAIRQGRHVVPLDLPGPAGRPFLGAVALNDAKVQLLPPDQQGMGAANGPTQWWMRHFTNNHTLATPFTVSVDQAELRHRFALQTCAGCHGFETGLDGTVVSPATGRAQSFSMTTTRSFGQETLLSPFLTGTGLFSDKTNPVAKDATGALVDVEHEFNDLETRVEILQQILDLNCQSESRNAVFDAVTATIGTRVH